MDTNRHQANHAQLGVQLHIESPNITLVTIQSLRLFILNWLFHLQRVAGPNGLLASTFTQPDRCPTGVGSLGVLTVAGVNLLEGGS